MRSHNCLAGVPVPGAQAGACIDCILDPKVPDAWDCHVCMSSAPGDAWGRTECYECVKVSHLTLLRVR